ncbi:hypothetical protein D9M71_535150 [compost metagenome]
MVAALEDATACGVDIRGRQVEGHAQVMPALGHGNRLAILLKGRLVAAVSVLVEVIDGVFLALGPQALPRHITTHCRQRVQADAPEQGLKQHHSNKWPDNAQQLWRFESPFSLHEVPCNRAG